jgi:3-phenylpropionate/trans-cinnamate dioxygenase ferredoxin reductase subunit
MTTSPTFVIAGASLAGTRAAETLRGEGFSGTVLLIGAEPDLPYERPPLSKQYLRREMPRESVFLHTAAYYDEQQIHLRLGQPIRSVHPRDKRLTLAGGEDIGYDKLLITTGAHPRRLHVPGVDLRGVSYLRTVSDSEVISEALSHQARVLVVGAGFIGSEVAASARLLGCDVTLLEAAQVPMAHALGEQMGALCASFQRDHDVRLYTGDGVAQFRGAGQLEEAITNSGRHIPCDVAVIGVGVEPTTSFLSDSGMTLNKGIVTDEYCRTSAPDVFAAGDVANWWHPTYQERLHIEHFDNAENQGRAAARCMLGQNAPFAPTPYFWSDQYDLNLEYAGYAARWDQIVLRGDATEHSFCAFYLQGGRIKACFSVNRSEDLAKAQMLIAAAASVDARQLADDTLDLATLGQAS